MNKVISIEETAELTKKIIDEVQTAVVGKTEAHKLIMAAILSQGGHILLEDFPGLGKTLVASCFAHALGMDFKRIQFTPDLLPGDITGGYVFDGNQNKFTLKKGPVFTNILLADEINRASPKTQSALLEAMQEHHVTLEGETLPLPEPFIVMATQNPIEYEGTFPLPEAQLDRFIIKLSLGYPSADEEREILSRRAKRKKDEVRLQKIIDPSTLIAMRNSIEEVYIDSDVQSYIIGLMKASREHPKIVVGASPRGSLALLKLCRAWAAIHNRNYVTPDDVKQFTEAVLIHRIILDPSLWDLRDSNTKVINEIKMSVKIPVFKEQNEK
ncbi:MAG: MoxR family ATPase [Spirochaetales bacterium]|nr:MoxR family ATPase [Spirochaetales bacterium]